MVCWAITRSSITLISSVPSPLGARISARLRLISFSEASGKQLTIDVDLVITAEAFDRFATMLQAEGYGQIEDCADG